MLRGQGGIAPAALRGRGRGHISLSCIDLHAGLTANLPVSGLPRLGACFAGFLSCSLLAPLLDCTAVPAAAAAAAGYCSRLWVTVNLPPKGADEEPQPIVGPSGLWTCRRVDFRWFHLVEQTANDNARRPPSAAARAPPRTPFTGGQADWTTRHGSSRSCPPFCSATADYS